MVGSGCYSPFKFSGKHLDAEGFRFFGRYLYIYIIYINTYIYISLGDLGSRWQFGKRLLMFSNLVISFV